MSILDSLTKDTTFDSHGDIVTFIKQLEEDFVYLRRGDTKSVKSYNNDPRNKVILDEKVEFKTVQYRCSHFGTHVSRAKKGLRLKQHVMSNGCPVQIRFTYEPDVKKFVITKLELVHQDHPVSKAHLKTYARKKHLAPEALDFAKSTLVAGAQPTKVRKLLLDKFGSHLISKDIINLKQTLTVESSGDEWKDVVEILSNLKNDENNGIKVLHDSNKEVAAIFVQLSKQRKLYSKYGAVLQLDGTYNTNKLGFALYHLMIEDNNGDSQPVAMFFIREETTEAISECLRVFSDNNEVAITKAVDFHLTKMKNGEMDKEKHHEVRENFRAAMYAETQDAYDKAKAYLIAPGMGSLPEYFSNNWFNIEDKFHHAIKDVLQKTKRLGEVIQTLVNVTLLRLSDRERKQKIREVRFSTQSKPELITKFAESISPFAWNKLENEIKIMRKNYHFILDNYSLTYTITSRNTNYQLKRDLNSCTCHFHSAFGLPCRHIIYFHFKDIIEIPAGSFAERWRNECLERDQYNLATNLFRKMAETIIFLTIPDFQEKMRLFHYIQVLIKADKPIQLVQFSRQEDKKEEGSADLHDEPPPNDESTDLPEENEKISSWAALRLPVATKKWGRPKENNGYFNSYHKQAKKKRLERTDLDDRLDEEEAILNEEAENIARGEAADIPLSNESCEMVASASPDDDLPVDKSSEVVGSTVSPYDSSLLQTDRTAVTHRDRRIKEAHLFLDRPQVISKNNYLNTGDINLAQVILKRLYPAIGGLYCSTLGASLEFPPAQGDQWLQIIHNGSNHWVCVAKGFTQPNHVLVYDSAPSNPWKNDHILSCMSSLL
uniref:SWIM-type domain-containing protein n=1 Tax=Daphnia galeata TaxID=27404 RepID=A0A8J2WKE1_9CRUS|nr:unnamed protein product [Daphnia galeata]